MRINLLFCFLLLGILYLSLAQVTVPIQMSYQACTHVFRLNGSYEDCCLRYAKAINSRIKKRVSYYRRQELDGGCNIPAIVFKTKADRVFCANPEEKWVVNLMRHIDKRHASKRRNTPKKGIPSKRN